MSYMVSSEIFGELLDSLIVDVASECHRIARLGLGQNLEVQEEELMLSAQARVEVAEDSNNTGKYVVDIFGNTHPTVANEVFDCMNCGRSISAGRFAPHLEKCMGKGRKARLKVTRSSTSSTQNRYSNSSATMNRLSNGSGGVTGNDYLMKTLDNILTKTELIYGVIFFWLCLLLDDFAIN